MNRQISQKKRFGVFYTPKRVTDILCTWAIKSMDEIILEPSFGGCDFLDASINRFKRLGLKPGTAKNHLFGCDIDSHAFDILAATIPNANGHFKRSDFLSLSLESFSVKKKGFNVVIGNPPYVSHHNMADEQKSGAAKALKSQKLEIGGRASLWAYFVLHGLSFLQTGGRMAWVLPSSFLYADYADKVREILESKFEKCLVINLHERLFLSAGTEEISVIVLCKNLINNNSRGMIEFISVSDTSEMETIVQQWDNGSASIMTSTSASKNLTTREADCLFERLSSLSKTKSLGDLFDIQIGIVSGANWFFILNKTKWKEYKLPESIMAYVLTKFRFAKGSTLKQSDVATIRESGETCLLVDTTKAETINGPLADYLASFPKDKMENTTTFKRRKRSSLWHRFNDNRIPDAFFPYMQNKGTWIVVNEAQINATNSIHRFFRKEGIDETLIKLSAISILSTFSQISSEIEGRIYGAGVLKHEPSEAENIKLLLPDCDPDLVKITFIEIDNQLRLGLYDQARNLADHFLLEYYSDEIKQAYQCFDQELSTLQIRRMPLKKKN